MTNPDIGPWVDPDRIEDRPWETQTGIVKFFEFVVPKEGMSPRAFHLYWQKHHSPHALNVTIFSQFMRKYTSGHRYPEDISAIPLDYSQDTNFQGVAEVWINSVSQVGEWLGVPEYETLIQPDEPRFTSEAGDIEFIIAKEERLFETDPDLHENMLTKLFVLIRKDAALDYNAFHAGISAHGRKIIERSSLSRHLKKFVISHKLSEPLPLEGFESNDIDAVLEFWFDDAAALARFFSEPDYTNFIIPGETQLIARGATRAIAAKMRVVHDEFSFQPSTTQPMPFSWT